MISFRKCLSITVHMYRWIVSIKHGDTSKIQKHGPVWFLFIIFDPLRHFINLQPCLVERYYLEEFYDFHYNVSLTKYCSKITYSLLTIFAFVPIIISPLKSYHDVYRKLNNSQQVLLHIVWTTSHLFFPSNKMELKKWKYLVYIASIFILCS